MLDSDWFADKYPAQAWAVLLDEGQVAHADHQGYDVGLVSPGFRS